MWIKANDLVEVLLGEDSGKRAKVLRVLRGEEKLIVEGVNRVYKHVRKSQKNPRGGRLSKEMPIAQGKVAYVCGSCSRATRLGARLTGDGSKERYCKKCGAGNGILTPAKKSKTKASAAT